ncbi:Prostatic acid phosphatase [Zootermopsis nevadensis]|uniref:Prostatic acid phosphatase n=2 Tax=Zootermopsis nevadensis TaxID=136037 RepID=A0A067QNZ9_ZOONE|nr:Prostatic acid phosphatase [Zootermopsis nevadensis]
MAKIILPTSFRTVTVGLSAFKMIFREVWSLLTMFQQIYLLFASPFSETETELQLVHVLFRHGQRTPADTYPTDPYINYTFEPVGWGQLTNSGKLAQYHQGQYLRARYNKFLGALYSPEIIVAQSTDVDRTKMSAQLELAGLWPPAPSQQWNPDLLWQPIPLHSEPLERDSLLLVRVPCPKYQYERNNVKASTEVRNILAAYNATELYQVLAEKTGTTYQDPDDVQSLYSTLKAEEDFNLTLPEWTNGIYPNRLIPLTVFSFVLNAYNTELQKLKGGPLLKKIISDTKEKVEGTQTSVRRKMFMYAGHDSTISNLLSALNVWDPQIPGYGIMVLIELHHNKETGHHIKLFLRNTTDHDPYPLTIPGCDTACPLDQFRKLTDPVVPRDWKISCVVDDPNYKPPPPAAAP